MPGAIQRIKEDLEILKDQVTTFVVTFSDTYRKYLEILSQAVQKQLIVACYQICTQIYPDEFLKLSFNQRQKLQEDLRNLAQETRSQLLSSLDYSIPPSLTPSLNLMEQMLLELPPSEEKLPASNESEQNLVTEISNPEELVRWSKHIEQNITEILDDLSQKANLYLQQAQILPSKLPPKLLNMAIHAEEGGMPMSGAPNLLNLLVEAHADKDGNFEDGEENAKPTKITAIHLRLSEVEFTEPTVSLERNHIRSLLEKLSRLRQHYRQKQRELAIAEAETAWRASWYET